MDSLIGSIDVIEIVGKRSNGYNHWDLNECQIGMSNVRDPLLDAEIPDLLFSEGESLIAKQILPYTTGY